MSQKKCHSDDKQGVRGRWVARRIKERVLGGRVIRVNRSKEFPKNKLLYRVTVACRFPPCHKMGAEAPSSLTLGWCLELRDLSTIKPGCLSMPGLVLAPRLVNSVQVGE